MIRLLKYLTQYRFRDIGDLIRNEKREPKSYQGDLKGKSVIISGATSGIGFETAWLFAEKGAKLILLNRNKKKSEKLEIGLKESFNCEVKSIIVDFNSLSQVRTCSEKLLELKSPIDVIIHNAGVFNTKKAYSMDNIEMVFQVNHLGSFLINYLLRHKLKRENRARIINVSSEGHRFALAGIHLNDLDWRWHLYTGLKSYGASKTAQLLTMYRFRDFFRDSGVTINSMHPGNVVSSMGNNNGRLYRYLKNRLILSSARDPKISAKALLYLSVSDEVKDLSGCFFNLTTLEKPAPHGRDYNAVDSVWEKSLKLCGLK